MPDIPTNVLAEQWSDEPMHVLDGTCWCNPEATPSTIRHRDSQGDLVPDP